MTITIEKNIPIPANTRKTQKYPWGEMAVGDSFYAATDKPENFRRNLYQQNKNGKRFVGKPEANGFRVWRAE